jgi:hypothetical protein
VVHIFSHIRQTLNAEELVLLAPSLDAVCATAAAEAKQEEEVDAAATAEDGSDDEGVEADGGTAAKKGASKKRPRKQAAAAAAAASARPALRWVAGADMVQAGLTSGVRKVFNLSVK